MPLAPGQMLNNRYRIVKLLREGGFGAVYRAWDTHLQRPCALKENLAVEAAAQTQFEREARILSNLSHPGLPRVFDHFVIPGQGQYLVMDYIDGQDLEQMLQQANLQQVNPQQVNLQLSEPQALSWITQVCDALTYLHAQQPPIIHRDIKPANIKITPEGRAVLVDFGIAKIYAPHLKTTVGARALTPGYAPHEQYGQGATDTRTDIYALGATLYHILTGQEPVESIQRMVNDRLVAPEVLNPSLSPGVAAALKTALSMDPAKRFQSAAQFKAALLAPARPRFTTTTTGVQLAATQLAPPIAQTYPSPAPPAQAAQNPPGWVWAAGLGGLAVFAILLMVIFSIVFWRNQDRFQKQTEAAWALTFSAPTQPPATLPQETAPPGQPTQPATAPPGEPTQEAAPSETAPPAPPTEPAPTDEPPADAPVPTEPSAGEPAVTGGKWVAYGLGDSQVHRDLYLRNIYSQETIQLTASDEGSNGPTFSPDGRRLAFANCRGADCQIFTLEVESGQTAQLTSLGFNAMFPDWCKNPSRPWIIFEGREGNPGVNLWVVNAETGEARRLTDSGGDGRPSWSPDCSQVVFGRALSDTTGDGQVTTSDRMDPYILEVDSGQARPLLNTPNQDEFQFAWSPAGDWIAFCRIAGDTNGDNLVTLNDQSDLWIVRPDGSQERNLSQGQLSVFSPSWAPDGAQIVFSEDLQDSKKQVLWILALASLDLTRLTDEGYYFHPVWSP